MNRRSFRETVRSLGATFSLITVMGIISLAGWLKLPALQNIVPVTETVLAAPGTESNADEEEQLVASIYQKVSPSVVHVRVLPEMVNTIGWDGVGGHLGDGLRQTFYVRDEGAGFVWDQEGHIVTNYQIVEFAENIEVTFFDGTTVKAQVIGHDPDTDLALLKVDMEAERLQPVRLANSDGMFVGQRVVAMGTSIGPMWTATPGTVTGLSHNQIWNNNPRPSLGLIQTNIASSSGNYGGPLVNVSGELVGVNTELFFSDGSALDSAGFAVPSNIVGELISILIADGEHISPWLIA